MVSSISLSFGGIYVHMGIQQGEKGTGGIAEEIAALSPDDLCFDMACQPLFQLV